MTDASGRIFLGLDVGTQSTKALLVDVDRGKVVGRGGCAYPLIPDLAPGAAEQHADTWIEATRIAIREALANARVEPARVAAIGVSGQQHGFVALDDREVVIRAAKLWCDVETAPEARELTASLGRLVPAGYTASKILWLKRHEPESFARLATVLLPHDSINFRMTGRRPMEAGDASGTGLFDAARREFDLIAARRVDHLLPAMLPPILAPNEIAGTLLADAAEYFGLPAGIPISCGGGDNMMAAIGAGATRPGVVVASLGTSGTVFTYSDRPLFDPDGLVAPFCDSTGGWLPLVCVMNATNVTEEVRAAFSGSNELDLAALTKAAEQVPIGSDGVTLLPYLQGERVPDLPDATAAIVGLRPGKLRAGVLFRAALEGVSLNLAWGVERMRALGVRVESLRLVGGGAKNALWRRILADVMGVPVVMLDEPESAALGAALQAAAAWRRERGEKTSVDDVAQAFVQPSGKTVEPNPDGVRRYRELARTFRAEARRIFHAPALHRVAAPGVAENPRQRRLFPEA